MKIQKTMPNERQLWESFAKTKDPEIRERFIIQYAPLVKYVAGKVAMKMPQNIEFDDLVGYGIFGLLDAIEKFDFKKEVLFKTYAVTRIRGAIYDELRVIDWVPRSVRQEAKNINIATEALEGILGRQPTIQELAEELGMPVNNLKKSMLSIDGSLIVSINDAWYLGNDSDKVSIIETIESPNSLNPDIMVEKEEVKNIIVKIIEELPKKEKKVLILYYYENLTLKEVGKIIGVTESRVSQLKTKAMKTLRAIIGNSKRDQISLLEQVFVNT